MSYWAICVLLGCYCFFLLVYFCFITSKSKIMKQKLYILIALFLSLWSFSQTFTDNGINYNVTDPANFKVEVAPQDSFTFSGEANLPNAVTYNGNSYSVTSIGNDAFSNCNGLNSIVIPDSVTSIGNSAFYNCSSLPSITIPNTVTSIGDGEFSNCILLASVAIPSAVTIIKANTFRNCSKLTAVTILNTITSIGDSAFTGCSVLNAITIPSSVTTIGGDAFGYCTGLTAISIPNSVTSIGIAAFYGCTGLTSITIPSSVTTIEASTFESCSGVTSITISSTVTSIDEFAFSDCVALTSVTVLNSSPLTINANVFNNITLANVTLNVPSGSRTDYKNATVWKDFKFPLPTAFTIGDLTYTFTSATTVSVKAANKTLTSAIIPAIASYEGVDYSVTVIEADAFKTCTSLTNVSIPSSITSTGSNAFNGCTGLTSVKVLHTTPLTIGLTVFSGVDVATIPLSVPAGKAFTYMSEPVWKNFKFQFTQGDLT
jgi:BspA type Leucine rich repeat region (6 copies)